MQEDEGAKDRPEEEEEDKDEARGIGQRIACTKVEGRLKLQFHGAKARLDGRRARVCVSFQEKRRE